MLRYRKTGLLIAVVLAQHGKDTFGDFWRIDTPRTEAKRTVVVGFFNEGNTPNPDSQGSRELQFARVTIRDRRKDGWLLSGRVLTDVSHLLDVLEEVRAKTGPLT